jgi:hypothetical protein
MEGETKEVIIVRKYAKWPFVVMAVMAVLIVYLVYRGVALQRF